MRLGYKNNQIQITLDSDDAEELRYGLSEALRGFLNNDDFPLLDELQNILERGIENLAQMPIFPFEDCDTSDLD